SDRPGGEGGFDLYRARVLGGVIQRPAPIGEGINTEYHELDPALSLAGFGLDFSSNRPRALPEKDSADAGDYDIYCSEAREVFVESGPQRVDWAGLWSGMWPWLRGGLLALLLLALLWLLRETLRNKRLNILAKCL